MPAPTLDRWILLRIGSSPRTVWVSYLDDHGTRREPVVTPAGTAADWELRIPPPGLSQLGSVLLPGGGLRFPPDLGALIAAALAELPDRYGPHANGPVPLPIFVEPPPELAALPWESVLEGLLQADPDRIQLVRLARPTWTPRPLFRLPLRMLAVGLPSFRMLQKLRNDPWYLESPETQAYGLHIAFADAADIERALRAEERDVVVCDDLGIEALFRALERLADAPDARPRLLIYLDEAPNQLYPETRSLPPGTSMLWLPLPEHAPAHYGAELLYDVLINLIHDYPLHEATRAALRNHPVALEVPALLIADPASNHDLRLATAFEQLQGEAIELDKEITAGEVDTLLQRIDPVVSARIEPRLKIALQHGEWIQEAVEQAKTLKADFQRETFGLVPLAKAEEALARARTARGALEATLHTVVAEPGVAEQIGEQQERVVDVTLDQLDTATSVFRPLEKDQTVRAGAALRLNVHIGNQDPQRSLVVGEPTPIDPLLPELEDESGHTLEVAVFAKDFTLRSPAVQTLYLPRFGGSEPIHFQLTAPEAVGPAELRLGVYHRSNLLQSFLLRAEVDTESYWSAEPVLTVELDLSNSTRFTNLDELKDRGLSIGVNQDADGRTHTFMLMRDGTARGVRMTEGQLSTLVGGFRALLAQATEDKGGKARFPSEPSPDAPIPTDFQWVVGELAEYGRKLYRSFKQGVDETMQEKLDELKEIHGETIQITLHHDNFAFPWSVLYDYPLPVRAHEAPYYPVCLGKPFDDAPANYAGQRRGCPHNPHLEVYCVEGFWGVRHRIEQLVRRKADAVQWIVQPRERARILLAAGLGADKPSTRLTADLRKKLGDALVTFTPEDDLLSTLWEEEKRPAVLIVIGHLETRKLKGEPAGPRLIPFPKEKWSGPLPIPTTRWVHADVIAEHAEDHKPWKAQPHTLVLLMACSAAAFELGTLNHVVRSFTLAGAGAVVGTECIAFSGLVARFAREVVTDLWSDAEPPVPLGEAIRRFTDRLIHAGNPLGLVFTCYGNADLTLFPQNGA